MEQNQKLRRHSEKDIQILANQLSDWLETQFARHGDSGTGVGIFSKPGRGDGSLYDGYREAAPDDDARDYHNALNARLLPGSPSYVHTHANRFEQRGVIVPCFTGQKRPGSNEAIYEREQMTFLLAELLMRTSFRLGLKPGLIVSKRQNKANVVLPDAGESQLLRQLNVGRMSTSDQGFIPGLRRLQKMTYNLEFAVLISDFMLPGWEQSVINIGQEIELVVFHIVDPWDVRLPSIAKANFRHNGQSVEVDTGKAYYNFAKLAELQQQRIKDVMQQAGAQHYRLSTTKALLPQLKVIFSRSRRKRKKLKVRSR